MCPNCRKKITASTIEDIPIIISLKDLISRREHINNEKNDNFKKSNELSVKNQYHEITKKETLPSVGSCEEHDAVITFKCSDCSQYVCASCAILFHKSCSTVLTIQEAMKLTKEVELKKLSRIKRQYAESLSVIENDLITLDEKVESIKMKIAEKKSIGIKEYKIFETLSRQEFEIKHITSVQELDKAIEELNTFLKKFDIHVIGKDTPSLDKKMVSL